MRRSLSTRQLEEMKRIHQAPKSGLFPRCTPLAPRRPDLLWREGGERQKLPSPCGHDGKISDFTAVHSRQHVLESVPATASGGVETAYLDFAHTTKKLALDYTPLRLSLYFLFPSHPTTRILGAQQLLTRGRRRPMPAAPEPPLPPRRAQRSGRFPKVR